MSILLVSTSASKTSINKEALSLFSKCVKSDILDFLDYSDKFPLLADTGSASSNIPESIKEIYERFQNYEKLVFFLPEHNAYFSAFFKNVVDWMSLYVRDFLKGKKVYVISASTTKRDVRVFEPALLATMSIFCPLTYRFFNLNKYGENKDEDEKRIREFAELVESE